MYPDKDQKLSYHTEDKIYYFSHAFDPLSNWSAHRVRVWGRRFATVVHAYQFKKFDLTAPEIANMIASASSPWAVMQLSTTHKALIRDDWDELKVNVMVELATAKLNQNDDVSELLRSTGTMQIIENSPWDSFWGCGEDGMGKNTMGKIWMSLRDEPVVTHEEESQPVEI